MQSTEKLQISETMKEKNNRGCWEQAARQDPHLYRKQSQKLEGALIPVMFFLWVIKAGTWGSLPSDWCTAELGKAMEDATGWYEDSYDNSLLLTLYLILKKKKAAHEEVGQPWNAHSAELEMGLHFTPKLT